MLARWALQATGAGQDPPPSLPFRTPLPYLVECPSCWAPSARRRWTCVVAGRSRGKASGEEKRASFLTLKSRRYLLRRGRASVLGSGANRRSGPRELPWHVGNVCCSLLSFPCKRCCTFSLTSSVCSRGPAPVTGKRRASESDLTLTVLLPSF